MVRQKIHHRSAGRAGFLQTVVGAGNFAQFGLFNNDTQGRYLVIRHFTMGAASNSTVEFGVTQANLAGTAVTIFPLVTVDRPPPGSATWKAGTATLTLDYAVGIVALGSYQWPINIPFAILTPGWSFIMQNFTSNIVSTFGVLYEAYTPEELDEGAWIQANAALLPQNG
jgi:hypothetical protein